MLHTIKLKYWGKYCQLIFSTVILTYCLCDRDLKAKHCNSYTSTELGFLLGGSLDKLTLPNVEGGMKPWMEEATHRDFSRKHIGGAQQCPGVPESGSSSPLSRPVLQCASWELLLNHHLLESALSPSQQLLHKFIG